VRWHGDYRRLVYGSEHGATILGVETAATWPLARGTRRLSAHEHTLQLAERTASRQTIIRHVGNVGESC